ncbi:hypothetical protein ACF0H5_006379 [Mactra antiquata]
MKCFSAQGLTICVVIYLFHTCSTKELEKFTSCNNDVDMEQINIHQGELELVIRDWESSSNRLSCDFTIRAGSGRQLMFYFTDLNLGSPNRTQRVDKACVEPRDVTGNYEIVPSGMRALICSRTEVEVGSRVYATTGSALRIRFFRNRGFGVSVYFKLVFTSFRLGSCRTSERRCRNERCIAHEIVCNGHNPCGDHSDCPTGLEHLSSWALSGIVVLALLSGGIIIIMAAVCLQRASSKRYDFDDILIPANGSLRQDQPNVEMNDVSKKTKSLADVKHVYASVNGSDRHYITQDQGEDKLLIRGYESSIGEPLSASDREKLIKVNGNCVDTHLEHLKSQHILCEHGPDQFMNLTERQISNADILRQAKFSEEFGSFGQHSFLVPEDVTKSSSALAACKNDRSLVYSDSDSDGDDMFKVKSLDRKRGGFTELSQSSSHEGGLRKINDTNYGFADFKPPPPPYDTQNSPTVDRTPNKVLLRR